MLLNSDYAEKCAAREGWKIRDRKLLRSMPEKWMGHENPDPEEISKDWAEVFCEIPYDCLLETSAKIGDYSRQHGVLTGSSWIVKEKPT